MNQLLTLFTGICVSISVYFNGSLEGYVGNFSSLLFLHISGLIVVSLMFLKKRKVVKREKKSPWYLIAGILGIAVVSISNKLFNMGGVLLTLSGTLAGQVITALVMELLKNRKTKESLPLGKILSLFLVLPGAVIIGLRSGLPFYWIIISWIPGFLIMLQSFMNSQNVLSMGFRKTLFTHYASAFIILLIMLFFIPVGDSFNKVFSGEVPFIFVIGGGTIATVIIALASYLLLRLKPITFVLLIHSGQLGGALFIDYLIGQSLSSEKLLAMILIIGGLFVGELKFKRKT